MKRIFFLLILLIVTSTYSYAQLSNDRVNLGIGFGGLSGLSVSPYLKDYAQNDINVTIGTAYLEVNALLKKINPNRSISFNTAPGVNLSAGSMGFITVGMPMTMNYNTGILATSTSDKRTGFTFGLGALIQSTSWLPLPNTSQTFNTMYFYAMPCIQTGFSFSNSSSAVNELLFQVGFWSYKPYTYTYNNPTYNNSPPTIGSQTVPSDAFAIRFTMIRYLNFKK